MSPLVVEKKCGSLRYVSFHQIQTFMKTSSIKVSSFKQDSAQEWQVIMVPSSIYKEVAAYAVRLIEQKQADAEQIIFKSTFLQTTPLFYEQELLRQVLATIEQNVDNADFSISMLRKEIHISNTMLYRKVKALTGFSPNELLKSIRMKKAYSLLSSKLYNVSEVAYKVGFDNPRYFSRCFKTQFGQNPSDFKHGV